MTKYLLIAYGFSGIIVVYIGECYNAEIKFMDGVAMGLSERDGCTVCGVKMKSSNIRLTDGSCICVKCNKELPFYLQQYVNEHYELPQYWGIRRWVKEACDYSDVFTPTAVLGGLLIDGYHGLFTLGSFNKGRTPILRFGDIEDYSFTFEPSSGVNLFTKGVYGNVVFHISMRYPDFCYDNTLLCHVKAKRNNTVLTHKPKYELPEKIKEFEYRFGSAYIGFLSDESKPNDEDDLSRAMHLFMISDLNTLNKEQLDEVSNRLLDSFRAGGGELSKRYEQRICEAYNILQSKVVNQ